MIAGCVLCSANFWMFTKTPYSPQLHTVMAGGELNSTVHAFTYFDGLHSRSFWVVARGKGELTEAMYKT